MGFTKPGSGGGGGAGSPGAPGAPGVSVSSATINGSGHLILTLSDGSTVDAGVAKGVDGSPGAAGGAGPGLPAGGVAGQLPRKTSSTDYAVAWYTPTGLPGHVTQPPLGRWWKPNDSQSGTLTPAAAGAMYLFPVLLPAVTLQNVALEVTSGTATALVRLGMYADLAGGGPDLSAPLWDGGTQDASTPGIKTYSTGALALTGGVYWMAVVAQVAIPILRAGLRGYGVQMVLPSGQSPTAGSAALMLAITGITGTLPSAPGTTPSQQNTNVPSLWFQRSATV